MITPELLVQSKLCDQGAAEKWSPHLGAAAQRFEINTAARVAGFLAQCAHESGNFRLVEENLNYSAEGLLKIFGKYFDQVRAAEYARQPQKIASRVYANRMGNGDEASGEGYKYRGRGLIQLTGKDNYRNFGASIGRTDEVLAAPELVAQPELAALSAAWFWGSHGLNALADAQDIIGMTKRINGGTIGLDDRKEKYAKISSVLAA